MTVPRIPMSADRRRFTFTIAACAIGTLVPGNTMAQAPLVDRQREALVKAAFLHKFFSFVEWPEGTFPLPTTPLRIGVLGDDEVLQDLQELSRDRPRDGRPVVATRVQPGESLVGYHIVYLKPPGPVKFADLLAGISEGVLTVADTASAHPKGSVISFFIEEGRVGFGISLESAARQKLRLNSRLLSVARRIQGSADALFRVTGGSMGNARTA